MKNCTVEPREQHKPVTICIFACIPEKEEFQRRHYPLKERVKGLLKNGFNEFCTRATGRLHFDTYSYMTANGLRDNSNRGDIAIRMAIKSQLGLAFAPRPVNFFEVAWRELTDQNIEHINRHADLFVIAGGGYIFVNGDGSSGGMLAASGPLTRLNCPIVAYGIGLNRLMHESVCSISALRPEAQNNVKQLSELCREISVRDRDTGELFGLYGSKPAAVIGDPALYFSEDDRRQVHQSGRLTVGVNLAAHGWRGYSILERLLPCIVSNLTWIQSSHSADLVYLMHHDLERPIVAHLQSKGLRLRVIDGSTTQLIDAYKEVDLLINQMLHSCIFAANSSVPFLNIAYDKKSVAFCSLLDLPECVIEHSEVTQARLTEKFVHLHKNRAEISSRIMNKRIWLRSECRSFLDRVVTATAEREEV